MSISPHSLRSLRLKFTDPFQPGLKRLLNNSLFGDDGFDVLMRSDIKGRVEDLYAFRCATFSLNAGDFGDRSLLDGDLVARFRR